MSDIVDQGDGDREEIDDPRGGARTKSHIIQFLSVV
jgi:hypothetical protein